MKFALKMMNFASKMINCVLKYTKASIQLSRYVDMLIEVRFIMKVEILQFVENDDSSLEYHDFIVILS